MKLWFFISLLSVVASSLTAQTYSTDAFGVFPITPDKTERSNWADTAQPPAEVEDILLFVGQKSHVAGRDIGHAVAVLVDRHGNLVANGTNAEVILDGTSHFENTLDGIAELVFPPGTVAGTYDAAVISGASQSARATYRVTADLTDLSPKMLPQNGQTKPENFVAYSTDHLTDRYGNSAPSGVGAQMILTHSDGSFSIASATVLNGRAQGTFLLRDLPSKGSLSTGISGNSSVASNLQIEQISLAAQTRVILTAFPSINAINAAIGPVTTSSGYYLNDGAGIAVQITGASGKTVSQSGWLRDGRFDTVLPIDPTDQPFTVTVQTPLGEETSRIGSVTEDEEEPE